MIRQKTEQYVCVCIWAMLLAIGSVVLADQKLLQFIMEESYKITERDLLNVIFMTDQFGMYPYLNKVILESCFRYFLFIQLEFLLQIYLFYQNRKNITI